MKTRTLILLAMACGLAILVAGGVFLGRVIANKDELTVPDPAGVGETQQVGPVRATLLDYAVNFAADLQNDNGFLYAMKGLMGGYHGRFSTFPAENWRNTRSPSMCRALRTPRTRYTAQKFFKTPAVLTSAASGPSASMTL